MESYPGAVLLVAERALATIRGEKMGVSESVLGGGSGSIRIGASVFISGFSGSDGGLSADWFEREMR